MFEEVQALLPSRFFEIKSRISYESKKPTKSIVGKKKYLLPDTSDLLNEEKFAKVALCWNEKWLFFQISVENPDSIELFIDTRNRKSAGFTTKFCHHFIISENSAKEITKLRVEDQRELADSSLIKVENALHQINIFLPSECLYYYDPKEFSQIGFTYRINRIGGKPQHFSVSSKNIAIEQHPSLWAHLDLIEE